MAKTFAILVLLVLCFTYRIKCQTPHEAYLGQLSELAHGLKGHVLAIDDRTLRIKNLHYDGQGPDAYFWAGNSDSGPDQTGFIVPDEHGSMQPLKAYHNKDVVLRLPHGKTLRDVKWFGMWCRLYAVNFGNIYIP